MKLWLNYPLSSALEFLNVMRGAGYQYTERVHMLTVGPLAFAVIWRRRVARGGAE
jgi:hypothetical protein